MDVEALRGSPIGQLVRITGHDANTGDYDHFAYLPDPLTEEVHLETATWHATMSRFLLKFSGGHSVFRLLPDRTLRV
jgi:hypothetical protein